MKRLFLLGIITFSLVFNYSCNESNKETNNQENSTTKVDSMLRHVVIFKFNETATQERIKEVEEAFKALPAKISEIKDFEWGLNNSPEGLDKGFTHCFFVSFKNEEDRAIYLPHPDHKEFVSLIGPSVDDVLVIDYWTN